MKNLYSFLLSLGSIESNEIIFHYSENGWALGTCQNYNNGHYKIYTQNLDNIKNSLFDTPFSSNLNFIFYVWDEHPHSGKNITRPIYAQIQNEFCTQLRKAYSKFIESKKWMIGCEVYFTKTKITKFIHDVTKFGEIVFNDGTVTLDSSSFLFVTDEKNMTTQEYLNTYYC